MGRGPSVPSFAVGGAGVSLSRARLFVTPWTAAYQTPPSMGFSRKEYWSGVPVPFPEKEMAPHSSLLAWKIPWMEESGRLQSMGSQRVGHG